MNVNPDANGISPRLTRHAPWCARFSDAAALACNCKAMPALRCNSCGRIFEPDPGELPLAYSDRVQLHASVHENHVTTFEQGKVVRTLRDAADPEPGGTA